MKTAFSKSICSLASLLLALTLTLSCSDDNTGGGGDGGGSHSGGGGGDGDDGWQEYQERLKYYDPYNPLERCNESIGITERMCEAGDGTSWYNPLNYSCSEIDYTCDENYNCTSTYALKPIEICGDVHYVSSDSRRCMGGVIQGKCEDVWYNRETHYCDWDYNPNTGEETSTLKAKERCGGKYYAPGYSSFPGPDGTVVREPTTRCQNGVIQEKCGGWNGEEPIWYNRETQYCSWDNASQTQTVKPRVLCGGEYIEPDYERCNNGVVEERCDHGMLSDNASPVWYNYITQTCVQSGDWQTGYTYTVRDKVRCGS
jgi:hypothetical protein